MILLCSGFFFSPLSIWCPTAQMILKDGKCLIYTSLSYQLWTGRVASLLSSNPSRLHSFCMFFERSLKCDDNSHERRDKNCHLQQNASLPLPPNFFCCSRFSSCVFWQEGRAAVQRVHGHAAHGLSWVLPTPTSVTQLACRFSVS